MFTGIVEGTGRIASRDRTADGLRLTIGAPELAGSLAEGQSVAVDGACLTVERHDDASFTVFLASETVDRTVLGGHETGTSVNLERAMPADGRFDGHLVQGHVDTTTRIEAFDSVGEDWELSVRLPSEYDDHIVEKGSITLDGVSLTVADRDEDTLSVAIIPETYERTTFRERSVGDPLHVEIDVIAKYVASMLAERSAR